jgi:restriction endonuclease
MMVKQTLGFPSKTRMTMKMIRKVLVTIKSSFKNLKTVRKESLNGIAKTIRGKLLRRVECKHDWRPLLVVAP